MQQILREIDAAFTFIVENILIIAVIRFLNSHENKIYMRNLKLFGVEIYFDEIGIYAEYIFLNNRQRSMCGRCPAPQSRKSPAWRWVSTWMSGRSFFQRLQTGYKLCEMADCIGTGFLQFSCILVQMRYSIGEHGCGHIFKGGTLAGRQRKKGESGKKEKKGNEGGDINIKGNSLTGGTTNKKRIYFSKYISYL